jgi:hypothetical protein
MWKNIVERGRPQMAIWRMRTACWITKATDTHTLTMYNIHYFCERASILRYTYIACPVIGNSILRVGHLLPWCWGIDGLEAPVFSFVPNRLSLLSRNFIPTSVSVKLSLGFLTARVQQKHVKNLPVPVKSEGVELNLQPYSCTLSYSFI